MTYQDARRLFTTAKNKDNGKPLSNHTRLKHIGETPNGDTYAIQYWNTYVVMIHEDGTYTLDSGGWQTITTKKRINEYAPVYVFQKNYEWFLEDNIPFYDGMKINSAGEVIS